MKHGEMTWRLESEKVRETRGCNFREKVEKYIVEKVCTIKYRTSTRGIRFSLYETEGAY